MMLEVKIARVCIYKLVKQLCRYGNGNPNRDGKPDYRVFFNINT